MPIFSYLAYPNEGKLDDLIKEFNLIPQCKIIPAKNKKLGVLVTDTRNEKEEEELQSQLKQINNLQCLTMVFGCAEPSEI